MQATPGEREDSVLIQLRGLCSRDREVPGSWVGVYYSEELKAVSKYGYKIEIIKGVEFSKANIFGDYIKHFYDIKKNSVGALRFIGKNHLNYLY